MPAPTNPYLITAMTAITADDTPKNRRTLYEALLDSTLIVPTIQPIMGKNGTVITQQEINIDTLVIQHHDGRPVWLTFTDEDALRQWRSDGGSYVALAAIDLFQMAVRHQVGMIDINPQGAVGGYLMAGEIAALARRVIPGSPDDVQVHQEKIQTDTKIMIGAPTKPLPLKVAAQLQRTLATHPTIAACYVFMLIMGSDAPQHVAGITFHPQPDATITDSIMRQVVSEVTAVLKSDSTLSFMILHGSLLESVRGTVHPAYVRQ